MIVTCINCNKEYDDARCWTICPHREFLSERQIEQKDLAIRILGKRVRFNHQPEDLAGHRVMSCGYDGMVTVEGMSGEFAPHLFVVLE